MIKVMKNAQKIIRRDPDLMTVMQININDSDITSHQEKKEEPKKYEPKKEEPKKVEPKKVEPKKEEPKISEPPKTTIGTKGAKKTYGNLFG